MMKRSITIASIFAALLATGCKQETTAPEPVRPVLSILVEPARATPQPRALSNPDSNQILVSAC